MNKKQCIYNSTTENSEHVKTAQHKLSLQNCAWCSQPWAQHPSHSSR